MDNIIEKYFKIKNEIITMINESLDIKDRLVVCDIQPAYYWAAQEKFLISDFVKFLNTQNFEKILIFFNGKGYTEDSKDSIITWYKENGLLDSTLEKMVFVNKGFGWARSWLDDKSITDDEVVKVLQYLNDHALESSDEIKKMNQKFPSIYDKVVDGVDDNGFGDEIELPPFNLDNFKKYWNGANTCGGFSEQCKYELDILMDALKMLFTNVDQFIYGLKDAEHAQQKIGKI